MQTPFKWKLLILALAFAPMPALAAFPMPKGEGRIISTLVISKSEKSFDNNGNVVDGLDYDQTNIYVQGEYGLTDDLTLLLSPSYRNVDVEGPGRDTSGLNFVDLGGRYRVATSGSAVFSLQGVVRIPGKTYRDPLAQISQSGTEIDLRGQVGAGFGPDGKSGFVIGEGGYRFRAGGPPNEYKLDVTVGLRATQKLLLLASLYNTFSDGGGAPPFSSYRYHNAYLTAVYDISDRVSIQFGGQATLDGKNALRERGLVAGFWFKF